jgi:predicted  nucleic acid-binding Zn-ribbon protein
MGSETVEALLLLQEIDSQIGLYRSELRELQAEEGALDEQIQVLGKRDAELRTQLQQAELEMRRCERTVQAGRETLKRLQARAQEVHNMREHLAARAEVDAARQNLEAAEDRLLDSMQDHERARSAVGEVEDSLAETRDEYDRRKGEIAARCADLEAQIAVQVDRRENRALRMDEGVRSLYDRVKGGRASSALAPLLDGVCGHCYTSIPLQTQAEIRAGRHLVVCETCGVILHVAE